MKSLCLRLLLLFVCAISVCAATQVVKIQGMASVSLDDEKTWVSLKAGNIPGGALIKTGKDSFVDVKFTTGSSIRLTSESIVKIDKDEISKEETLVQLSLSKGRVIARASGITNSSKLEIIGQRGVCGTRTENCSFDVTADGLYRCFSGTVIVIDPLILGIAPSLPLTSGYESPPSDHRKENLRRMSDDDRKKLGAEIEALEKSANGESK